jgi:4-amino-4-deoxy-L-arabinose transferase-like glycosyltransferase
MRARLRSSALGPHRRLFVALVLLALVVRLAAVAATPGYVPRHDDADYDRLACWIADHAVPASNSPPLVGPRTCDPRGPHGSGPTAYRPPLWPIVLGATYTLPRPAGMSRWTAGRVIQAVLGTGIAALTGLIAAALWGPVTGLVAVGITAVFLPLVLDGASLISEPLFVLLLLAAVLTVLRARQAERPARWAALAGAFVGLAALTRANGPVIALPLMAAVWGARPRLSWRAAAPAAALAAAAILVVAPWTVRNAIVLHAFVPISTSGGNTLYGTYNETSRTDARCPGCWLPPTKTAGGAAFVAAQRHLPEPRRDARFRAAALRFIRRHPAYPAQVLWHNTVRLLELGGRRRTRVIAASIDVSPRAAVAGTWFLWAVLALGIAGAVAGTLRRVPWFLTTLFVLLWLTTAVIQSETPRFRAPFDPFLIMLAAAGAVTLVRRATRRA